MTSNASARAIGAGSILLALGFNVPYAVLASRFDYPGILREAPERILAAFTEGGAPLVLTWYAFALAAMLFIPVSLGLALGGGRVRTQTALAVAAAVLGALAGLTQAIGLLRWVMVVPVLAADPEGAQLFAMLHAYAGVAIGEHLGMLLTATFLGTMAVLHAAEGLRALAAQGGLTAAAIAWGAIEGVALALGADGAVFSLGAIAGYLLLTVWLLWAGLHMIRGVYRLPRLAGDTLTA
ncbi:hypothetical protein Rumeso_02350 [Rubellimicrobium mesophilum DSM 19309]|uniref:DUF4386 family protein n=1 Tax=Rubellimicrobium mesophilum DSM 19309 TaxID=442562 RepID=A0A017HPM2_9RHOB|nr:DUF4386 family protein [Rubellimicrobium mesophilum]EYD76078.1 hypothetical protein Rumeso_02350 [Rubellimicrobium mesophilum DSM 19309]